MKHLESIGERIEYLLEEKDMTQRELANRSGITEVTIGRYVKDAREPKGSALADIAIALNTTTDYLLGLTDNPNKDRNQPTSLAAHFDGEMTEEEEKQIRDFAQYLLDKKDKEND